MRARLLALVILAAACPGEVVERIAVTVGKRLITQSDILKEIRLSAFLDKRQPDLGPDSRRKTAERLVERALADTEMAIGNYPAPDPSEVNEQLAQLRKEQFPNQAAYAKALADGGVREEELRLYLSEQLALLRFIDARFGPGAQILEEELQAYYSGRFTKEWENKNGKPPPSFEEVRSEIMETLRGERVDRMLDQWLKEACERTRIDFKAEAFQ